jgi:hypothetical protein
MAQQAIPNLMNGRLPSLHHKLLQVDWRRCIHLRERLGGNHPSTGELIISVTKDFAYYKPTSVQKKKEERKPNESQGRSNVIIQEAQYD